MLMYDLPEYKDNYSKSSGSCKDVLKNSLTDSESFILKFKLIGNTNAEGTKNLDIAVPLKYLGNFGRTLEMSLNTCEIKVMLNWSTSCVICEVYRSTTFAITDTSFTF